MKQMLMTRVAVIAIAAGALMAAGTAQAAPQDEEQHVTVRFGDLNPTSSHDMQTLYIRLKNAAQTVCGDDDDIDDLLEHREINQCEQQTIESAVAHINTPLLTSLYDQHFPRAPLASRISVVVPHV